MSKPTIAFLGLGIMGTGMSHRLLAAGFPLTVYNRTPERAGPVVAKGARLAPSARDAAASADIIITMLADDIASRGIWLGKDGALAGARKGATLIDCSTVSVGWIRELNAAAQAIGCSLLDAPVTGSKPQAAAGELLFLVGGPESVLETARPVLSPMSKDIIHLGPSGSGVLMKLINNFVCGTQLASLAEGLALIERSTLDRAKALSVLTGGAPASPFVKAMAARMTARDYTPNFLLRLMAKDITYAQNEARARSLDLKTAAAALTLLQNSIQSGDGDKDLSAIIEQFRDH